jgi:hypothetical protein
MVVITLRRSEAKLATESLPVACNKNDRHSFIHKYYQKLKAFKMDLASFMGTLCLACNKSFDS